jgi:hypothetical protein
VERRPIFKATMLYRCVLAALLLATAFAEIVVPSNTTTQFPVANAKREWLLLGMPDSEMVRLKAQVLPLNDAAILTVGITIGWSLHRR